jgi:hypothetical protein
MGDSKVMVNTKNYRLYDFIGMTFRKRQNYAQGWKLKQWLSKGRVDA